MKRKYLLLTLILLAITLFASACGDSSAFTAAGWAGLTASEDTAYLAFGSHVYAINLTNGAQRWRYPESPDAKIAFYAAPGLTEDNQLIVGAYNNTLYSLDANTGRVNWEYAEANDRYIASALVTGDLIFAPSAANQLHALDLNGFPAWASPFETEGPIWSQPVADANCACVYISSMDGKVYAIDPVSGALLWASAELGGAIVGSPAVSDGRLYVGTFQNEMIALNAENGRELWRFPTNQWIWDDPVVYDGQLLFGDLSGTFYALDAETGASLWQVQPGNGAITGKPLVTEAGIYFTTQEGSLVFVNHQGIIQWSQSYEGNLYTGPVAAGDLILIAVSNADSLLFAVNANGVQQWAFTPEK